LNNGAPTYQDAQAWVLAWQKKLHRWSVEDRTRIYPDLFNLIHDPRTLQVAWQHLRANRGSKTAGIDGETRFYVETRLGTDRFLQMLREELKAGTYRPRPVREKGIPKKSGKIRYLGIPTLRDRVVQQALRMVLEPIFEAGFYTSSYGYRPKRRAQDAIEEIYHFAMPHSGYGWIVEGDIRGCFDNVDHALLLREIRERIADRKVVRLVVLILKAGVMTELGSYRRSITGTPQGGIASPLLSNVYLSILDRHFEKRWQETCRYKNYRQHLRRKGVATYRLVRFADDFVLLVKGTKEQAETLKQETAEFIRTELLMELSLEKTRVTSIREGFNFLGHRIVMRQSRVDNKEVLLTLPSKPSLQTVKDRIKELTSRGTTSQSLEQLLAQLNPVLRGWSYYFRFDAAKRTLAYLDYYAWQRVFCWMRVKHPHRGVKALRRKYFPTWEFKEGKQTLFRPSKVPVERYLYRGARIPNPWSDGLPATSQPEWNESQRLESLERRCSRDADGEPDA
jgi:RNA-directed DNA polymerase